jgi:hypothetical protein
MKRRLNESFEEYKKRRNKAKLMQKLLLAGKNKDSYILLERIRAQFLHLKNKGWI